MSAETSLPIPQQWGNNKNDVWKSDVGSVTKWFLLFFSEEQKNEGNFIDFPHREIWLGYYPVFTCSKKGQFLKRWTLGLWLGPRWGWVDEDSSESCCSQHSTSCLALNRKKEASNKGHCVLHFGGNLMSFFFCKLSRGPPKKIHTSCSAEKTPLVVFIIGHSWTMRHKKANIWQTTQRDQISEPKFLAIKFPPLKLNMIEEWKHRNSMIEPISGMSQQICEWLDSNH